METHLDLVGMAGLVVGLVALLVAIYGVRDVREQVKLLVTLERNVMFARELHHKALQLVKLPEDAQGFQSNEMHGLSMLARAIDSKQTLESVLEYTNKEAVLLAQDMVHRGLASWRDNIDESRVNDVLRDWQKDKNAATLQKIFGRSPLFEPEKHLMS